MPPQLTSQEKAALRLIQAAFPLTPRPFAEIGRAIGLTEQATLNMLDDLKRRGILKEIRGIFDARLLGFSSALAGFQVDAARRDAAAQIVNAHPGVSHNYGREHRLNLWFTIAVPQALNIETHVSALARLTGCAAFFCLPGLRTFKRRVQFEMPDDAPPPDLTPLHVEMPDAQARRERGGALPETERRRLMAALQDDLPLMSAPFAELAQRVGITEAQAFDALADLRDSRVMPRFAGILRHRQIGYTANAMAVWQIPAQRILPFAERAAALPAVSHCYERVSFPDWPYNLYTMIHGTSRAETERIISDLARQFGVAAHETLYSTVEYKKRRVDYFSDAFAEWEKMAEFMT